MDEATAKKLSACAHDLLDVAPGRSLRDRIFCAIAAIAWESGDGDKPGFDASPVFHAFSDAMSTLVADSGVKRVDVVVVNTDGSVMLYQPNAKQPTVHDLNDDGSPSPFRYDA